MVKAKQQVTVALEPELGERLAKLEQEEGRSTEALVLAAVERYVEEQELERELADRWAEYKATGMAVPNEEVVEWLQSLGTDQEKPCPKPRRM
jgi:predicted transcriptional regulator